MMIEKLKDIILEKVDYREAIKKMFVPVYSRGRLIHNIIQIIGVMFLFEWCHIDELILNKVDDRWSYIVLQVMIIICIRIFSFLGWFLFCHVEIVRIKLLNPVERIENILKYKPLFLEYDTYYEKRFLKEKLVPVRQMLEIYISLIMVWELIKNIRIFFLNEQGTVEEIYYLLMILGVYSMFCMYTKQEYEQMRKKKVCLVQQKAFAKYKENVKKFYCRDVQRKTMGNLRTNQKEVRREGSMDQKEWFLYSSTGNLNHLELMRALLEDKSVLTDTPFYKDMGVALFMPLHEALLREKKIIVLSGGSEGRKEIEEWIRNGLLSVSGMEEFWRIKSFKPGVEEWDIGIVMPDDMHALYKTEVLMKNTYGVIVIILHPERLLTEMQSELCEWGYMLSRQEIKPVYVIIERAMLGLLDTVSHIFSTEFLYISTAARGAECTQLVTVEGTFLSFEEAKQTPKLHLSEGFARCAEKAGVQNIRWQAGEKIAFYDINSIRKQYLVKADDFFDYYQTEAICKEGLWGLEIEKEAILIYEDEFYHVAELFRQLSTRGELIAVVSIVGGCYLLYPYLFENIEKFSKDMYAISAIAPVVFDNSFNRTISFLGIFSNYDMNAMEIRKFFGRYFLMEDDFEAGVLDNKRLSSEEKKQLKRKLQEVFGDGDSNECQIEIELGRDDRYVLQLDINTRRKYENLIKLAVYYDEEEKTKTLMQGRYFWQIDQLYLPGQIVVFDGKLYEVKGREFLYTDGIKKNEVLVVRRCRSSLLYYCNYFQKRVYQLKELINNECVKSAFGIEWYITDASFSVETKGYYNVIYDKKRIEYRSLTNIDKREYSTRRKRNALVINWSKNKDIQMTWEMKRTLVILFGEVFKTLFPKGYPYIAVLISGKDCKVDSKKEKNYEYLYYTLEEEEKIKFDLLILEDSELELGILSAIDKHMEHILRIIYSYCRWWKKKDKNGLYNIMETTVWDSSIKDIEVFLALLETNGIEEL